MKLGSRWSTPILLALVVGVVTRPEFALATEEYSPNVSEQTTRLFWGDTHLHTVLSADAYMVDTRLTAHEAYRFARGETVKVDNGMPVKLRRPLDFLAVSDHAEYLGIFLRLHNADPDLQAWDLGRRWSGYLKEKNYDDFFAEFGVASQSSDEHYRVPGSLRRQVWHEYTALADEYNDPGKFTAFIAYEWTSMESGDNLHRVVLYRDNAETVSSILPLSAQDSTDPEVLWDFMARYESSSGGKVFSIPHNGNVSNGRMFADDTFTGVPLSREYAEKRMRWEPIYEVTQVKGDGETHPLLSPDDEFADFETWDEGNINLSKPKKPEMLKFEYARSAYRRGLEHKAALGANPFKFGMIGSTDSHTAVSTTEENNFFGKFLDSEPSQTRFKARMGHFLQQNWQLGASGLAAVWAQENTRESLFDAMQRKEVYATTGSRIQVRFFAGWEFVEEDQYRPDFAALGYRKGVPMGADLPPNPKAGTPTFLIHAARDPDAANLDRVQVIKGWLDENGESHEKIFNVAVSDERVVDPETGKLPPVGSSVDVENASYLNDRGEPLLSAVWTDPEFDRSQSAFYYLRVLEIPTPRWTAYDAKYFDTEMPNEVPMVVQDRAYTSPIWYLPEA